MNTTAAINYSGVIHVGSGRLPFPLFQHEEEAMHELEEKMLRGGKLPFSGLLVVPTGGGKTLIAVRWLLKNMINRGKKVLWIAHRHELLEQAFGTIQGQAFSDVLGNVDSFRYRIVSGQHLSPASIKREDDIIIASKDSLYRGLDHLQNNWLCYTDEVFLVVDEAHHAVAKTYRKIIDAVKDNRRSFRMLGLTATAFRTAKSEEGLLGKLFKNDVVYKIDLRTLINRGILAEPEFEELKTGLDMESELSDQVIKAIQAFDELPELVATRIAASAERNKFIVQRYIQHQKRYGKLLVFAINIDHAIVLSKLFDEALNKLFKTKGKTYSRYVVSGIQDMVTGVQVSPEDNKKAIQEFRENEELKVLVNVNILTEGTDLPRVQTVFLTRPTMSTILMTQMIGRALRGKKAGGKDKAYIVSFIDDWKDKICWVSPEKVCIETSEVDIDNRTEARRQLVRLISIAKIEEFAKMIDEYFPGKEALEFLHRVPVGIYSFSILLASAEGEGTREKNCEILVFDYDRQAWSNFVDGLSTIFKEVGLAEKEYLTDKELGDLTQRAHRYFEEYDVLDQDIQDVLRYYAQKGELPSFLEFEDRDKCDLGEIARYIFEESFGGQARSDFENSLWEDKHGFWQVLFGHNKGYFLHQLDIEVRRVAHPESFQKSRLVQTIPQVIPDPVDILQPEVKREIKTRDGYHCLCCGEDRPYYLQVDHIQSRHEGGTHSHNNLQTLCRICNRIKSTDQINFRTNSTPLRSAPKEIDFDLLRYYMPEDVRLAITRLVNFFYRCQAVNQVNLNDGQWQIELSAGNNPDWLLQHKDDLIKHVQNEFGYPSVTNVKVMVQSKQESVVAYCMKCKTEHAMLNPQQVVLPGKKGQPAWRGTCPKYGTTMYRITKKGK